MCMPALRCLRALRLTLGAALLAALSLAAPARADIGGPVTITLLAPGGLLGDSTPIELSDLVSGGDGPKLWPDTGTNIGSFMLPDESISFAGDSLRLRINAGAVLPDGSLVTGYLGSGGAAARYEFSGLSIAGRRIVGLAFSNKDGFLDSGFSGLLSPADPGSYVHLLNAQQLSVDLSGLVFKDRGSGQSNSYLELRIDLLTQPVPEPASSVLLLAGGLLLAWRLRRARG